MRRDLHPRGFNKQGSGLEILLLKYKYKKRYTIHTKHIQWKHLYGTTVHQPRKMYFFQQQN